MSTAPVTEPRSPASIVKQSARVGLIGLIVGAVLVVSGAATAVLVGWYPAFLSAGLAVAALGAVTIWLATTALAVRSRYPDVGTLTARNDHAFLLVMLIAVAGAVTTVVLGRLVPSTFTTAAMVLVFAATPLMLFGYLRTVIRWGAAAPAPAAPAAIAP